MSFLDLDEWLIELAARVDIVYSPLADVKEYPSGVDIALVEGAVANEDHLRMIQLVRERTKVLISFGDCAVTGNVTALRNPLGSPEAILQRVYVEGADLHGQIPSEAGIVPRRDASRGRAQIVLRHRLDDRHRGRRRGVVPVLMVRVARAFTLAVDHQRLQPGAKNPAQIAFERLHGVGLRHDVIVRVVRRVCAQVNRRCASFVVSALRRTVGTRRS